MDLKFTIGSILLKIQQELGITVDNKITKYSSNFLLLKYLYCYEYSHFKNTTFTK